MSESGRENKEHVHFMGIGGSGMSAVAMIAKSQGYGVSGCDLQESTPYLKKLKKANVPLFVGHSRDHLKDVDILTVTAAAFYQNNDHPELLAGKKIKIMQWQKFLGEYIQKGKRAICITGTHGKSTTTTMAGLLYEEAGLDPTVEIGATVPKWGSNYRIGNSETIINEADEFYGNFLNYYPQVIILNNIEFDHPDYFKSEEHVIETFEKFIKRLSGEKTLIFNQDSLGIKKLFEKIDNNYRSNLKLIGYTLRNKPLIKTSNSYLAADLTKSEKGTRFKVVNKQTSYENEFTLKVPGDYNVSNALGVISLARKDNISDKVISRVLASFSGTGRRMEYLGERSGVKVYDDYAHHPTEVRATLSGLRQLYPKNRIICVVEPHMYSRTKMLLNHYKGAFSDATLVRIAPIFKSRDTHDHGTSGQSIVDVSDHDDIQAFETMEEVRRSVAGLIKKGDIIVVMGAGKSYKLARDILKEL